MSSPDAIVVGAGPNGLAAALTLARAGLEVEVVEAAKTPGGGCRTEELTLPGFHHDVCSTVHPLLAASRFFRGFDLEAAGVRLRTPAVAFAHPLDGGRAGAVVGSVTETASRLGADGRAYETLLSPFVADALGVTDAVLAPIRSVPASPVVATRFALEGIRSASGLAGRFSTEEARGLLAGVAAHAMLPLDAPTSGGFGLLLAMLAHAVGWPVVEGGSARIVDALVGELERLGGHIVTGRRVESLRELSPAKATLLDLDPAQLVSLAGAALPAARRRAMLGFRHGPGVCKVDWAIDGPVPWDAEPCLAAGTLHLGGSFEEIARSEADVAAGRHPDQPYTIVVQPAVVDGSRAPQGRSTLWAYCHVPGGSTIDMTERIERQIERFAPGFRDRILARTTMTAADMAAHNPNYVGGDINGGAASLRQTLFRPTVRWNPYRTGIDGVYLCSASTSPGGGVHGMCGFGAATTALRDLGVGRAMRGRQRR